MGPGTSGLQLAQELVDEVVGLQAMASHQRCELLPRKDLGVRAQEHFGYGALHARRLGVGERLRELVDDLPIGDVQASERLERTDLRRGRAAARNVGGERAKL